MNLVYHKFLEQVAKQNCNWETDVFRCLLERDTSLYVPDQDHDHLDDFTGGGGVEISAASYGRQTLGTKIVTRDTTKDQIEYDCDNIAFGQLEVGQTVKGIIVYEQVGGDDLTPGDDLLVCYIDGKINVTLAADALLSATTLWVDKLVGNIPAGTALDFGGGATCTTTAAASIGDRSIPVTALAAAASAGADSESVTDTYLPAPLGGGQFDIVIDVDGLIRSYFNKG